MIDCSRFHLNALMLVIHNIVNEIRRQGKSRRKRRCLPHCSGPPPVVLGKRQVRPMARERGVVPAGGLRDAVPCALMGKKRCDSKAQGLIPVGATDGTARQRPNCDSIKEAPRLFRKLRLGSPESAPPPLINRGDTGRSRRTSSSPCLPMRMPRGVRHRRPKEFLPTLATPPFSTPAPPVSIVANTYFSPENAAQMSAEAPSVLNLARS